MYTIRLIQNSEAEYQAAIKVYNIIWPDLPVTYAEWKHEDKSHDPRYLFQRYVAAETGKIIASGHYCEPWWSYKPGKYYFTLNVHPEYRQKGVGEACYHFILKNLAPRNPKCITVQTREDKPEALHFLSKRGFRQVLREPLSCLYLDQFLEKNFTGIQKRMGGLNIHIYSLTELDEIDKNWRRRVWELEWQIAQDIPSEDPLTKRSFESFLKQVLDAPGFDPDTFFVAISNDRYVGLSTLTIALATPDVLLTDLTGVIRSHRRKGIATALKLRAIDYAKRKGIKKILTDNEENNPMYKLNLKLGFEPKPAFLTFSKSF